MCIVSGSAEEGVTDKWDVRRHRWMKQWLRDVSGKESSWEIIHRFVLCVDMRRQRGRKETCTDFVDQSELSVFFVEMAVG